MGKRESVMPEFTISQEQKTRLIWLSYEEGVALEEAVDVLLDFYEEEKKKGRDMEDLENIISLSRELDLLEVSPSEVQRYLEDKKALGDLDCDLNDVAEAVRLISTLTDEGFAWGIEPSDQIIALATWLAASGVSAADMEAWLKGRKRRKRQQSKKERR